MAADFAMLHVRFLERSEEHAFDEPEHVPGAQHDAEHRPDGEHHVLLVPADRSAAPGPLKHPHQQHDFAREPVHAGQADAGEGHEHQKERENRCPPRDAGVGLDLAGVIALVQHPDEREQSPGRQAVVNHLQRSAGQPEAIQREKAQQAEAHMADGAIGDHPFDVALRERHECAVDDSCD